MSGQKSVKETVEAINGLGLVSRELILAAKDGISIGDFVALATKESVRLALVEAGVGIQNVPAELKELDRQDISELVGATIQNTLETLKALGLSPDSEAAVVVEMLPEFTELMQKNIDFSLRVKARLDAIAQKKAS